MLIENNSNNFSNSIIGPKLSSFFDPKRVARVDPNKTKLEVIVPVFDPGLSKKAQDYEEEGEMEVSIGSEEVKDESLVNGYLFILIIVLKNFLHKLADLLV